MKKLIMIGIVFVVFSVVIIYLNQSIKPVLDSSEFQIAESEFDFGVIKQSGGLVSHDFEFTYTGDIERQVLGVPGSCGCTTGEVDLEVLQSGTRGVITVTFDPNLHEEPEGRFYKTVSLVTDPPILEELEVKIWVEIDLDLGPEFYTLQSGEDDHEDELHNQGVDE